MLGIRSEDIYRVWAPGGALWSDWVAPVVFAELTCPELTAELKEADLSWFPDLPAEKTAVIVDLAGAKSILLGVKLAETRGFRPVPVINAAPGPYGVPMGPDICAVDMRDLTATLCATTSRVKVLGLRDDAPPVFLLDDNRIYGGRSPSVGMFDNRWMVFPQDFPSAAFLRNHGIEDVLFIAEYAMPRDDLAHTLVRWQEAGLRIHGRGGEVIRVPRPSRFRALWYRGLAISRLRRNSAGGFGSYVPESSAG